MPNTNTYTDAVTDWQRLLAAVEDNLQSLPDILAEKTALEQALLEARSVKAEQDAYTASRQEATQNLNMVLDTGRDLAMRIRAAAKHRIGARSERLVQFGIAPLRRRARRNPQPVPPPPSPVEAMKGR